MQRTGVDVKEVVGPKPLLVIIQEELKADPHCRCYRLEVSADNTTIILTGKVRCYYHKQMANEAVRRVLLQDTRTATYLFKNDIVVLPEPKHVEE
jgi:osmotically-inducible protein OsmY